MQEIPSNEPDFGREAREHEPKGREIDVYFFRHGQATGQAPDAELTELGGEQAREAAETLLQKIVAEGGGVIKFLSSPVRRAVQTREIMETYISNAVTQQEIRNIRLMEPRERTSMVAPGITKPLKEKGIADPTEYWLTHPDVLVGKNPHEVASKIQRLLRVIKKTADRLPPGEKIFYAPVLHEPVQAAFFFQATGKTPKDVGGTLRNGESFRVHIEGKSKKNPTLSFRDVEAELKL